MLSFNVIIYSNNHIMTSSSLTTGQNTTHTECMRDIVCLFSCYKAQRFDSLLIEKWENLSDFRKCLCVLRHSLKINFIENLREFWLIVLSITMEFRFLRLLIWRNFHLKILLIKSTKNSVTKIIKCANVISSTLAIILLIKNKK